MRIYFVLEYVGGRGGVETVVTMVTQAFANEGHDVHVFLPSPSFDVAWESNLPNVHYYYAESTLPSQVEILSAKCSGLADIFHYLLPPDLVVATHVPQTCLYSRAAISNHQTPVVSWLHCIPELCGNSEFINYADIHWAISQGIASNIEKIIGDSTHVYYIGNPIELCVPKIQPVVTRQFVFVGRLENNSKRLDVLLKGLSYLKYDWSLNIFGTGPDEEKIKQDAEQLGIKQFIKFHGWVFNVWERIQQVTSLILTSDFEGMPMVIGEALARGVPVISSDCVSGPRDLIKHGINGWLFPVGDVNKLVSILEEVATISPAKLSQISGAARLSVLNFSRHKVIERMKNSLTDYSKR